MIERLEVPCPTCGESGFTLGKIWNQGEWVNTHVVCPACHGEKVVPESDAAYIERMKRVIDEIAASKQENGNLFDRLRMMAQEVTGRDGDIERLEAELAIEREPLTVRSIVDKIGYRSLKDRIWDWLAVHEYQGLYCKDGNDTCGCDLDDFCPCGCPQPDCRPAYRHSDGMMYLEDEKDV
jgi:hypothetical protein